MNIFQRRTAQFQNFEIISPLKKKVSINIKASNQKNM